MIVWKGYGILGLLIPFVCGMIMQLLLGSKPEFAGLGYIVGAIPVWYLGRKWNGSTIDVETGAKREKTDKHSLFWIHLEYWAIIGTLVGLTIIISEKIVAIETDSFFIIWGIAFALILLYQYYKAPKGISEIAKELAPIKINNLDIPQKDQKRSKEKEPKTGKAVTIVKKEETAESKYLPLKSRQIIEELKQDRGLKKEFKETDHSRYMPIQQKEIKSLNEDPNKNINASESGETDNYGSTQVLD